MNTESTTLAGSTGPEPAGPVPPKTDADCAEPTWREEDRLAALARYAILDTEREAAFDEVAGLAAELLDAPMAVVNLVAADRQWFKAEVGIGVDSLPLDVSICRHAILQPGVMVVPDLRDDPRFEGNPLVHVAGGLRFYAGALLETSDGLPLGTVCVLDREPRPEGISERQRRALAMLASQAMAQIELRRARDEAQAVARRRAFLLALEERLRTLADPREVMGAAAEVLGRHLDAVRVGYGEIEPDGVHGTVERDWMAEGTPPLAGRHRIDSFGPELAAELRAGREVVVVDLRDDLRAAGEAVAAAYAAIGARAAINLPLLKDGRFAAILYVHAAEPRDWSEEDVALAREVLARTWSAVERARAEARLRASEGRYRSIVEGADGFAIITLDEAGIITGWNSGAERLLGYGEAEAVGRSGAMFFTPEDLERGAADREMNRTSSDGRAVNERWHVRQDGSRFWGSGLMMRLGSPGEGFLKVFRDRTAEHEADAASRVSEARLRLAIDHAEIGFWDVEEGHGTLTWPPRVKAMFGISADQPVTMDDFYAGLHPDDRLRVAEVYAAAADPARRALYDVEYRTIGKEDGLVRWVAAKGRGVFDGDGPRARCLRMTGTAIDVTGRKQAEVALAESEARFRNMADHAPVMMWTTDPSGACTYLNRGWYEFTGQTEKEALGLGWLEATHPDDKAEAERVFLEANAQTAPFRLEYRLRRADGTHRWAIDAAAPRFGPEAEFLGYIGSVIDITERKQAEAALQQLNDTLETRVAQAIAERELAEEALRQSQKMEAMGQLTGGVAHDFNNLLTPIIGALDRLVTREVGSERERRLIAGALQSAERAKTLVQRLLAFARRQPLQPVAVDVSSLVRGMTGLIGSTLGPRIDLRIEAEGELPPARADANQVEMALLNLAVNARDAMPEGGRLTIAASRESVRGRHTAGLGRGHYVRLAVVDTGSGMDEATLARAVEPFFSTKGVGRGTGLGLSMVHGLAAQLGGGLTIDSEPGQGTTVALWLPISGVPVSGPEVGRAAPGLILPRGRALLVDDEDLVRMSTADMLMDLGFEVLEAGSGEEALGLLREGASIDLLVTDHLMPGMSGADLAREARLSSPGLPVLIVSGYAEAEGVAPNLPRLVKPFRAAELAERVAAIMPGRAPAE